MVKLIVYKDYDVLAELKRIWWISGSDGERKDEELKKLKGILEKSVEATIENGNTKDI
ncbi:hypothetical protein LCGC14_3052600 [marine sediment metagenome]|uniref:Uncharacterized protein n=1 Tax=marine sediment metagenome TaxID=412755 RepID=A0A0F8X9G0_9ZZZZ